MFSRFVALLPIAALAMVAAAAPSSLEARGNYCAIKNQYCCNKLSKPTTFPGAVLGGVLDLALGVAADVAVTCNPVTVLGLGSGGVCSQQQACCSNVITNGAVNVVCTPVGTNI